MTLTGILGFAILFATVLFVFQRKLIYFPQRYQATELLGMPQGTVEIAFRTSQGTQVAFYVPPQQDPDAPPQPLWVFFHGNAARALDWAEFIAKVHDDRAGFLLIDYPDFRKCKGSPSRAAIRESSAAAYQAFLDQRRLSTAGFPGPVNVLAFSIGTGAALDFAAEHTKLGKNQKPET